MNLSRKKKVSLNRRSIENRYNLGHVTEENFIEQVGISLFETVEINIFFETRCLASQLGKTPLSVVCFEQEGRIANVGYVQMVVEWGCSRSGRHCDGGKTRQGGK